MTKPKFPTTKAKSCGLLEGSHHGNIPAASPSRGACERPGWTTGSTCTDMSGGGRNSPNERLAYAPHSCKNISLISRYGVSFTASTVAGL